MTTDDRPSCSVPGPVADALVRLVPSQSTCLLAVSGGSDSMGLMHMAAAVAAKGEWRPRLIVGFVNHGLREGVDSEWKLVAEQADALGLDAHLLEVPADAALEAARSGSVQQWAREARYGLLVEMALSVGASYLATAHTLNDQAETVLLRMLRGTGLDGLSGIPESRVADGVSIVRPMLSVEREPVRDFLAGAGVPWVEDPSNRDDKYARTRIRHELIPLMESMGAGVSRRITALATEAGHAADYLDRSLSDKKNLMPLRLASGSKVDASVFAAVPREFWGRLVRFALRGARGDLRRLERAHIEPIEKQLAGNGSTGALSLPGDATAYVHQGSLFVFPDPLPSRPTGAGQPVAAGAGTWTARFAALGASAEIMADSPEDVMDFEVRARLPGDRVMGSERRFKEVLSAGRVPRPYRDFVPVLARNNQVVSCPALMSSRAEHVRVRWVLDNRAPFLDIDFPVVSTD